MRHRQAMVLGVILAAAGFAALAEPPPPRSVRLIGAAPSASDPAPTAFVIDAVIKPGDSDEQSEIEGWFAAIQAPAASGEVTGSCVEAHCTLSVALVNAKLTLTGDFGGAAPGQARFVVKDDDDKTTQSGPVSLSPLTGPVPGLGDLAAPDAIDEADMDDLLMWSGQTVSSGSPPSDPIPSSSQHEALANWQESQDRLATGLIFATDLAALRTAKAAAEKAVGWTPLGDPAHGWSAGYPAAVLPVASQSGGERRFASTDGKAVLVVAVDPPMSSEDFDAFVEKVSADRDGRDHVDTTRVNGDLEMSFQEGGVATVAAYHNRDGGLGRLVLTYPAERDKTFDPLTVVLQRQFKVTDDLKP